MATLRLSVCLPSHLDDLSEPLELWECHRFVGQHFPTPEVRVVGVGGRAQANVERRRAGEGEFAARIRSGTSDENEAFDHLEVAERLKRDRLVCEEPIAHDGPSRYLAPRAGAGVRLQDGVLHNVEYVPLLHVIPHAAVVHDLERFVLLVFGLLGAAGLLDRLCLFGLLLLLHCLGRLVLLVQGRLDKVAGFHQHRAIFLLLSLPLLLLLTLVLGSLGL
mmetsp:Transcript_24312/g.69320  ORF Transcript_24312/g.69320 Transcript_24312/m.69320 type:complete len:219 (-) Transcript_24312:119-775(-)